MYCSANPAGLLAFMTIDENYLMKCVNREIVITDCTRSILMHKETKTTG
jgi:hypothetical protein